MDENPNLDNTDDAINASLLTEDGQSNLNVNALVQSIHAMAIELKRDRDSLQQLVANLVQERSSRPATNVDIPPFFDSDPRGWFEAVFASFNAAHVYSEKDQFFKIVSQLPKLIRDNLKHKLDLNSFSDGKLASLKDLVIKEYEPSDTIRRERILDRKSLENQKPSVVWSWLMNIGKDIFSIQQLLAFWHKLLPKDIGLAIHHAIIPIDRQLSLNPIDPQAIDNIAGLSSLADALIEKYGNTTHQVSAINRARIPSGNRGQQQQQQQKKKKIYNESGPWCRNHFYYRHRANRCGRPGSCIFPNRPNNRSNRLSRSNSRANIRSNRTSRASTPVPNDRPVNNVVQPQPSSSLNTNQTN